MKKTRFLALTLVVSIMLLGAGYAIWTDSIQVSAVATTGNLNVKWLVGDEGMKGPWEHPLTAGVEARISSQIGIGQSSDVWHHQHARTEAKRIDDNTIEVKAINLYPGARFTVDMRAINVGTVPAKFTGISIDRKTDGTDGDNSLFNNLQVVHMQWFVGNKLSNNTMDYGDKTYCKLIDASWGVHKGPVWLYDLPALLASSNDGGIKSRVLEPDGKGILLFDGEDESSCIVFQVNPDVGNTYMDKWCTFRINLNFAQADITY